MSRRRIFGQRSPNPLRSGAVLAVIAIGLITVLAAVFVGQQPSSAPPASPAKPAPSVASPSAGSLPSIIGPGETALLPTAITIIDGDTIRFQGRPIRLVGFNAPETGQRARCARERELGERATAELRTLVAGGGIVLRMVPCACPPGTEGTQTCNFRQVVRLLARAGPRRGTYASLERLAKPFHCGQHSCPPMQGWC